jgi:4-hydroxy-tetrahydrodipicolinate reductase
VPNFSIGSLLLQRFARDAAAYFDHAEIVELHHAHKIDAPSGTALETARKIAQARGTSPDARSNDAPARGASVGGVQVHSVRMHGLYAHQEVLLGRAGELLTLRHDMSSPDAFREGLLRSVEFVTRHVGMARGLEAVIA